jgi:NhaA family Na+:H+ antiporter
MHPVVAFLIMPIFALSNAGITLAGNFTDDLMSPVAMGTIFGLMVGKVAGVLLMVVLFLKLKLATLPDDLNSMHIVGASFLAAIGFTMSLFIAGLAFTSPEFVVQAKIGILVASVFASFAGYFIIRKACQMKPKDEA